MNKYWLKITGFAVLVLVTAIAFYFFGSNENSSTIENKAGLEARHKTTQAKLSEAKQAAEPDKARLQGATRDEVLNSRSEKIYQIALSQKENDNFPDKNFRFVIEIC